MQGLLWLFIDKRDDFARKNEEFHNPDIKKVLATISGMYHQLFAAGVQARDIYPNIKKYFYNKRHSKVTYMERVFNVNVCRYALWY